MKLGIENLLSSPDLRQLLQKQRVALLGHPASVTRTCQHSLDALAECPEISLACAFGPQHGMRGDKQDNMIESPDFDDPGPDRKQRRKKPVRVEDIDVSIQMLERHLDVNEIQPLLEALQALRTEPDDESNFARLVRTFDDLGPRQGAVLTYAPYVSILLSDDPFGY